MARNLAKNPTVIVFITVVIVLIFGFIISSCDSDTPQMALSKEKADIELHMPEGSTNFKNVGGGWWTFEWQGKKFMGRRDYTYSGNLVYFCTKVE